MVSPLLLSRVHVLAPLPADLVSVVAAATPVNGALTIVAQPPQARKLQINAHVGTTTTTAITGGVVSLSGIDQDGNNVTETVSIVANGTTMFKSKNAYAGGVTASLASYAANGSGTGNTLGIGVSNDFGIPTCEGVDPGSFELVKASKITTTVVGGVTAWSRAVADDVAASAVVDQNARTIAPTTAPGAAGIIDYEFTVGFIPESMEQ